ncbi:MAG: DNA polymerase III subunit delta' [Hyphomicrobiaceae bacterium]|nr:MAG: DNA polymerase III subunit delta' [Hyphomicrobiaceae bacterium]
MREEEDRLESDRLGDFPHPRDTARLYGHTRAEAALREAFDGGRMHHAWMLVGREGLGKATLAYRLARYALASEAERAGVAAGSLAVGKDSSAARLIAAEAHPGLLVIRRQSEGKRISTQIRVEEVRRLRSFLTLTADEGAWRVVIVDEANDMNASAANAMLKSLEEPPLRTLFLLVTPEPGRLIATIRSRCRTIELAPLGIDDLRLAVRQASEATGLEPVAGQEEARLLGLAGGSVRKALSLKAGGGLELYERLLALMRSLPELDVSALHAIADKISAMAEEEAFATFYGLLLDLIARLVREAVEPGLLLAEEGPLASIIRPEKLALWAALWETIVRDKAEIMALNLDRKSFVLDTGMRMRALARG